MMTHRRPLLVAARARMPAACSRGDLPAARSAVAADAVDVEGLLGGGLVYADEALDGLPRAPGPPLAPPGMLVRSPLAGVGLERDDVVHPSVLQELRIRRDIGPAVPGDALGEELGIEPRAVLHQLVHPDLAVVGAKNAICRARFELARPDERQELGIGLPVEPTPRVR